jgi:hypothetical protein
MPRPPPQAARRNAAKAQKNENYQNRIPKRVLY